MRPLGLLVVAIVLAVGQVRRQEPTGTAPFTEAADPSIASIPESSGFLRPRPSLRSRLASVRPISRWLSRRSAPQDQEPVSSPVAENPPQPAESIGGSTPPVPIGNPMEGEFPTIPPAPGDPAAATADGVAGENRGSEPISATRPPWTSLRAPVRSGGPSASAMTPASGLEASGSATRVASCPAARIRASGPSTALPSSTSTSMPKRSWAGRAARLVSSSYSSPAKTRTAWQVRSQASTGPRPSR